MSYSQGVLGVHVDRELGEWSLDAERRYTKHGTLPTDAMPRVSTHTVLFMIAGIDSAKINSNQNEACRRLDFYIYPIF